MKTSRDVLILMVSLFLAAWLVSGPTTVVHAQCKNADGQEVPCEDKKPTKTPTRVPPTVTFTEVPWKSVLRGKEVAGTPTVGPRLDP